ncbi:MAG TPA: outer membrane beta-barrel protein [Xanthobacteraceae bacterium]|nr:outer membrane beta-barrel protein [Xanthobacteraceae bacterium]
MNSSIGRAALRCLAFAAAATTATAAFTPSVLAADLPVKSRTEPVVQLLWNGYYAGVHGGWGWGTTRVNDPQFRPSDPLQEFRSDGPIVGGQIGVNWQWGNVVAGLELDGSWAALRNTSSTINPAIPGVWSTGTEIHALATATARLGYAMGPWLAYAKAGGAYAYMDITTSITAQGPLATTENRFGVTGGAGMEVAFLRNVSAKVEYNYLYFPEQKYTFVHPNTPNSSSVDHFVHLVKVGINVRLGGDAVVARY